MTLSLGFLDFGRLFHLHFQFDFVALFVVAMIYSCFGWTGVIIAAIALIVLVALFIKSTNDQAEIQAQETKKGNKRNDRITINLLFMALTS